MPINKKEVSKFLRISDFIPNSLSGRSFSSEEKTKIKRIAGETITEEIRRHLSESKSPVKSGSFKKRKEDGSASRLFEEGDLWSSIVWEDTRNGLKVGVFDGEETPKAFNHTTGDTVPTRQFIPSGEEEFRQSIISKVQQNLREEFGN